VYPVLEYTFQIRSCNIWSVLGFSIYSKNQGMRLFSSGVCDTFDWLLWISRPDFFSGTCAFKSFWKVFL